MSRTITFYKLISPYTEDITKNCSLFGNEIDDNFMNLKELSIDSVELSGTTIMIKRIGNEQLTVDLSEIIPDEPTMSVSYDEELGKIQIDFNEETFIIDGLLNQVNSTKLFLKKVAADLTLTGNGTIQNPLTINLTHKTGMYEPAIEFLDLTSGDTLPTSGMSIGDSYVTKEVRNPFGYLYNLEGVNEIKQALLAENSEWRVPTKEDWDIMLNALECDEFKNHNDTEVSIVLGKDAGKILKSREYWQESNETNAGNDTYLFSSIPSGYGDDTKLITHAYEWGEYWTDTESSDFEHYTKQFRFDETGVYQLSRNINDYFSLRLVKTYNGENLVEYEKINNAIVKTDLMPSDSGETRLVWTMEDLNFGEDNYGGLRTPLLDEITETDLFYNVWNGNIWLKRKMKEGETTVILTDSGDTSYNIYMVVNHDFIKTDLSAMDNLIQTKQEKLVNSESLSVSGNSISLNENYFCQPILYDELIILINEKKLVSGINYKITNYTTTTIQADTTSAGHNFDIIVTALSTNELSEIASCVRKSDDTYFENAKLEAWEIKYCIYNDITRFAWADAVSGKGVIYYMKDEWNNECAYDFKNIQFKRYPIISMPNGSTDLVFDVDNQKMKYALKYSVDNIYPTGAVIDENNASYYFTFNAILQDSETYDIYDASVIQNGIKNDEGGDFAVQNNKINEYHTSFDNPYGYGQLLKLNNIVINNNINSLQYTELSYGCNSNTFGNNCYSNTFGDGCNSNTFGNNCYSNTFSDYCYSNNFYHGSGSGTTKKDYIRYVVLEDGCRYNNFYSTLTTSGSSYLQRIRIKGLENNTPTDIQITLSKTNTKYEWVICYTSGNVLKQYCPDD